jgi:hypothetical protein
MNTQHLGDRLPYRSIPPCFKSSGGNSGWQFPPLRAGRNAKRGRPRGHAASRYAMKAFQRGTVQNIYTALQPKCHCTAIFFRLCFLGDEDRVTVSTSFDHAPTAEPSPTRTDGAIHRIWPVAVISTGLVLTAAWTCLLGYGLIQLVAPVTF